jgi:hypothetical protein
MLAMSFFVRLQAVISFVPGDPFYELLDIKNGWLVGPFILVSLITSVIVIVFTHAMYAYKYQDFIVRPEPAAGEEIGLGSEMNMESDVLV